MKLNKVKHSVLGYTLIELLVVISVLGILTSVVVLSYSSWADKTIASKLKSDLKNAATAMENYRTFNNVYPIVVPSTFSPSSGVEMSGGSADGGMTFCIDAVSSSKSSIHYYINSNGVNGDAKAGTCAERSGEISAPTNVVASTVSSSSIDISFNTVSSAVGYIIQRSSNASFTDATQIAKLGSSPTLPFNSAGLSENKNYYYRVQTVGSENSKASGWSNIGSAMTSDPSVEIPIAPTVSQNSTSEMTTYTWTDANCAASYQPAYQYRYSINPEGYNSGWQPVDNSNTSKTLSFITSAKDKIYSLTIRARCFNVDRTSSWSSEAVTSATAIFARLSAPSTPIITAQLSSLNVLAEVNPVTCRLGEAFYGISSRINDGVWSAYSDWSADLTSTQIASQGVKYGYRAQAKCVYYNFSSEVVTSTEAIYAHPIETPLAPVVSVSSSSSTSTWSWSAVGCSIGSASYRYIYTVSPSGYNSGWVSNGTNLSVDFTTVTTGQTYAVAVQASCANPYASSPWSASGSASFYLRSGLLVANSPSTIATSGTPTAIAISPDGTSVYTTNTTTNVVSMYKRNTTTGVLTANSPSTISTSGTPNAIIVSPDGTSVYTTNATTNVVSFYKRNVSTGVLTAGSPSTVSTAGSPVSIAVSADGSSVYTTSTGSTTATNVISVFKRNTSTGVLTAGSPSTVSTAGGPVSVAVSPDGTSVYTTSTGSTTATNVISIFKRNTSTGVLTAGSPSTVSTAGGPVSIAVSADGNSVYTTSTGSTTATNVISVFKRNTSTGVLTAASPATLSSVGSPTRIVTSSDGLSAYTVCTGTTTATKVISQFKRASSTSLLSALSPATVSPSGTPTAIAISADGASVYVTSSTTAVISMYQRQ